MKISIITVTYNSQSTLKDCINSIIHQNHQNFEYILIDGLSTDGTTNIIKKYKEHISTYVSESDNGIYDAMNKGIKLASGEIICFLNSDDFYSNKEVLSSVSKVFNEDPTLDACYSDLIYVSEKDKSRIVRFWKSCQFQRGLFSKGWNPPHTTFFVRRSVYEKYGIFDLKYLIAADIDLMMRFLEIHKIKAKYIPSIWVTMRTGGTTNKNFKNIWLQNQEIIKALSINGLKSNKIVFILLKLFSRSKQFFQRPVH